MATKTPHPLKRTRSQSDIESLNDLNSISQKLPKKLNRKEADDNSSKNNNLISDTNWPRFLVIHQSKGETTKSLSNLSPFAVNKVIISLGGEPKSVKKLFSGDILVETQSKLHTLKLLKSKLFFDIPVTVTPHNSLNYSKGVIRSRELKDCSEEELLTELADQGVTAVKKIILSKNNKKITTGTIIFTFNTPEPPKSIKAAYLNIKVERYIPNPLRCFKCQKFGHHQTSCKGEAACGKCGGANHSDDSCENAPLCLNCKGAHPSFSRECPNFILEKQVVTYKYNFNTTFPEARKIVLSRTSTKSYAHVTAGNVKKDASTQTDHSWHNPSQKTDSTAQTQTENIDKQTIKKPQSNKNKQSETDIKHSNKNKTDKKKESAIPTPNKNTNVKTKIKTYERVIKPLTPTQLKTSTESIDFPPMDVIRSAAESQETTSDNGMEVVIPENSPKGYRSKYDEICRLLNDHNPTAMCLQETRLNDTCNTTIRRYSIYRRDLPSEHPAGGVCIIVNNQIPHSSVQLNSSLQAIAVRVSMHKVLTICSIYIPPSSPIIAADVEDLLRQLPAPALICGDFNGHNLLWGSRVTNPRGRTIENIILHNNLCLYNDTSMTYLDLSAGTYSALDLTLCHPSLFQDFTWMVDGDLHTSDHFPIHVKGNGPPIKGRPQRWKLHRADWTMFKQLCAEQLNISSFAEISDQYSEFITILLEVADISIPKTSQYPKRFNKPWFNKDCKDAVRERKRLLRKFSLRPTSDNLSCYRQAAAAARRTIRQAKRESWRQYSKWDGEINNKLHAIKPKLGEWALAYRKSRKEESILCRLRVGHTYLTHSFLLRNEAQPVCGRCQQPLTPIFGADGTIKPLPLPLPLDLSAGTYSALDLTLCHPSLFQDFTWMVDGDLHTSDHFPIHVKGNGPPIKGRPQRWKLHKADWTMFKQLCAEQLNISSFAEISDQYSEFITILLEVADISIPKTSQYPKRFDKPWFNTDCKDAVRERKRLLRKFSLRPTSDNLSCYRQAAAAARRTIRQAKRESWRQYVSKLNSQSSIKSAWDRLRKIRGKGTSDAYKHLNVGGTAITSQLGIANALGQSFCRNSSSDNCTGSFRSYKNRAESQQLDFKTTNTEVYNQVFSLEELRRSLRASKDTSPGPDSIHYQMLKHLPDCSLALILNIFNTIWITGAIPSSWLEATVIPIPKPGKDHTDPLNYRPIALTSCICKTMERMINCRLTYYLETNNILTRYQSGFRRQRSTIDHLVRFETLVREAFVRREHLAAVFFDLEKAYETTWNHVGISGNEKADFAAKSALSLPVDHPIYFLP
ncbi:RNA-directed DNA polymerase from mobile element jockey [Nymphon striatum]|nr:RNA-directed DNA polymerase from mobile element jockey [Nymphon striatum]